MTSFGVQSAMVPSPKSLTDEGMNAYKRSSASLCNSQTLAAEQFPRNKRKRSTAPGGVSPRTSEQRSFLAFLFSR